MTARLQGLASAVCLDIAPGQCQLHRPRSAPVAARHEPGKTELDPLFGWRQHPGLQRLFDRHRDLGAHVRRL